MFLSEENAIKTVAKVSGGYCTTESNHLSSALFAFNARYTYCPCSLSTDSAHLQDWHTSVAGSVFYSLQPSSQMGQVHSIHQFGRREERKVHRADLLSKVLTI